MAYGLARGHEHRDALAATQTDRQGPSVDTARDVHGRAFHLAQLALRAELEPAGTTSARLIQTPHSPTLPSPTLSHSPTEASGLLTHARSTRVFEIPDAVDVSTTSAFDFDVDATSGFMPPLPPITSLPSPAYDLWEDALKDAVTKGLKPGDMEGLTDEEMHVSEVWRAGIRQMSTLPTEPLEHSETLLRRAHHVLTYLLSFYAHSHPRPAPAEDTPTPALSIPPTIAVPLSAVSRLIGIAPVVTYADTVLWNWGYAGKEQSYDEDGLSSSPPIQSEPNMNPLAMFAAHEAYSSSGAGTNINTFSLDDYPSTLPAAEPTPVDLRALTLFTGLPSEAHFYLTSARIELASARALALMQRTLDELFLSDALAVRRIAGHLTGLGEVIDEMTRVLGTMRDGCDPEEFYRDIRPWFRGGESWPGGAGWEFEGLGEGELADRERERARWTNGASAGQSSIVHALDIFLGTPNTHSAYLHKMEYHMPRHHRAFLRHLRALPSDNTLANLLASPLATTEVRAAFNGAVMALKRFRDAHIRIAVLYVVTQARRAKERAGGGETEDSGYGASHAHAHVPPANPADLVPSMHTEGTGAGKKAGVKGTGGTDLVPFLKNLRDNTARTVVPLQSERK